MPANHLLGGDPPDEASLEHLRCSLLAPEMVAPLRGTHSLRGGTAVGRLTGGNLSLLAASLGTPWATRPVAGAVVFLEDVGEAPYRVDRLLTQLLHAGWFDGVAGIALGSWDGCGDDVEETLVERLLPLDVPILAGLTVGHGRPQLTIPLGVEVTVDADGLTLDLPVLR
jgi:muramoyltetrapeptide carboxypeptidase